MPNVLVVEDDQPIADAVVYALDRDGVGARAVDTLAAARLAWEGHDLLILDLTLPDGSGFDLLGDIRGQATAPRVIVLTSRDEDVDCVAALEAGADDFVTKPFSPRALVARVRAVLRRGVAPIDEGVVDVPGKSKLGVGSIQIDIPRRVARYEDRDLPLTKIEFDLLATLAMAPGNRANERSVGGIHLGPAHALTERTVDSHCKGLRRKLEDAGAPASLIETVRGVGFRLREEP